METFSKPQSFHRISPPRLIVLCFNLQANNVFIFPGVGFGAVMSKAKTVTDDMFLAAASALADIVDADRIKNGTVYPELEGLRDISAVVCSTINSCFFESKP